MLKEFRETRFRLGLEWKLIENESLDVHFDRTFWSKE